MIRTIEQEKFKFKEKLSDNNAILQEAIRANAELRAKIETETRKQAVFEKLVSDLNDKLKAGSAA